jgi:hypothetical protein
MEKTLLYKGIENQYFDKQESNQEELIDFRNKINERIYEIMYFISISNKLELSQLELNTIETYEDKLIQVVFEIWKKN